jgi:hypothetical protein
MGDRLFSLPAFRSPARSALPLAGRLLAFPARMLALVVLTALRLIAVLILRLLRPFIVTLLFLAIVGGIGAGLVFAYSHHGQDAMQAVLVTFLCSIALVLYYNLYVAIDTQNFENRTPV